MVCEAVVEAPKHEHYWVPIPSWAPRCRCSCGAVGLRVSHDKVEPYRCTKKVKGVPCNELAVSVVKGRNHCLDHADDREKKILENSS